MDGRLKRLLAAATVALAVGVVDVASADDHPAEEMRPMHDEMPMHGEMPMHEEMWEGHAHMGAGHHGGDMDDMHAEMTRQLPPEDRALHDRMHESCAGHTDERIDT